MLIVYGDGLDKRGVLTVNYVLINVSTPTYAMKVKRLLRSAGINGEIIKINTESQKGCSHAVKINGINFYRAAALLRENNVPYSVSEE